MPELALSTIISYFLTKISQDFSSTSHMGLFDVSVLTFFRMTIWWKTMSVTRLSVPISSKMRYSLSSENDGGQEGLALLQPGQHTSTSTRPHVA